MNSNEVKLSDEELDKAYEGLHMHYKYGYGPNGSLPKRIWSRVWEMLIIIIVASLSILAIMGLYNFITAVI